jgi:hypothetical protein
MGHPNPKLLGQNLYEVPDTQGKRFRKEIVDLANSRGSGWVDYTYMDPMTQREVQSHFKSGNLIVCAGATTPIAADVSHDRNRMDSPGDIVGRGKWPWQFRKSPSPPDVRRLAIVVSSVPQQDLNVGFLSVAFAIVGMASADLNAAKVRNAFPGPL